MQNIHHWKESKYHVSRGELKASRNEYDVMVSFPLVADLVAKKNFFAISFNTIKVFYWI